MSKTIFFIFVWISYLIWIYINNLSYNLITSLLVLLFLVVLFLLLIFIKNKNILFFISIIISFWLWIIVSEISSINIQIKTNAIKYLENEKQNLEIKILWINKIKDWYTIYKSQIEGLNIKWEVFIKWNYKLQKNTIIKINSKIYRYKDFDWFKYSKYMASKWLYYKIYPYTYTKIIIKDTNKIINTIDQLRKYLLKNIYLLYPKQEAIFLWWILIWARESIPEKLSENFNNSWLTHFIAVSWFNITIIILFFSFLINKLNPYLKSIIITTIIILFCILVWFTAPVIRAAIMWIIWYIILNNWRKWNTLSMIIFTLILMVSFSPLSINYDVSLHLSFLAVLWIIYFQDFFESNLKFITNFLEIRNALSLTLSAYIFTIPIMIISFWQISIVAPITNMLVAWTIPIAMLFWFISILLLDIMNYISYLFWFIAYLLLKWDIFIVNIFWEAKYSILNMNFIEHKELLALIYFLILIILILKNNNK